MFALAVGLTLCSVHSVSRLRLLWGFLLCSVLVFLQGTLEASGGSSVAEGMHVTMRMAGT